MVKQSLFRVPGGFQISRQSAHEGAKVFSPTHRPPLPLSKYSWFSFLLEVESTPPVPWWGWKDYVHETFRIEPATFLLVAQCLNQLRHRTPPPEWYKVKVIPQQAEVVQGVPGRLSPRIFLTFGTTRVVGRQPYEPAAFTPGEIPGTHFQRHMVLSGEASDTTGNRSPDLPTSNAVP